MAFLFKSKKNADRAHAASAKENGVAGSQVSLQSANGGRLREKDAAAVQTTPGSSVNNSMNSLGGGAVTPSPEQQQLGRRGPSSEIQQVSDLPLRNGIMPVSTMTSNPNASLYPWSQRRLTYTSSHPSPFPRYGAAVNSVASKEGDIYLMGGLINSATVKGDLWMVEAGGGNMACYPLATTAEGPGPRVGHASLLVGNAFIVYGGDTKMEDSDVLDETLYLLNTSTRQWSRAVPAGPRPSGRYGHSLNILGSKIYVFGGQVEGYFMNDLVAFDLNQLQVPSNKWEMLIRNTDEGGPPVGKVPPARTNHSVVTYDEKLYLFGGTNGFQWFNDVWCYDPVPNTWNQLDCIGYIPAPREGHAAALVDDVMYIFGGRTDEGSDLGDLAAFRISSRRWYTFQNMGPSPSPRSGHSMTAYNKQVIVLAGEPSSAAREAQDLSIVYLLDTTKIRYPNDQQIQQTPVMERVSGGRRPSTSEKSGLSSIPSRGLSSRDGSDSVKRLNSVPPRESVMGTPAYGRTGQPGINGNDMNGIAPGSAQPQGPGPGSKLPRASLMQAPSGPPPQQQAPTPRTNGNPPVSNVPRPKQTKPERGFGPALDTSIRDTSPSNQRNMSPANRESPQTRESPVTTNGRRTPTQQASKSVSKDVTEPAVAPIVVAVATAAAMRSTSKTRTGRGQNSLDSINESNLRNTTNQRPSSPPPPTRQGSNAMSKRGSGRNSQTVAILKELDAIKNRNAWYASELELAKKAGYVPNTSNSPLMDMRSPESFGEADRPLVEALIAMRTELANVQGSVDQQAVLAAKKIAEVEKQRDAAVSEAVYAKAKLAAHGGSARSTPQMDNESRDIGSMAADRSTDIAKKLAAALALQKDLQNQVEMLSTEVESEKRNRQLAEDTASAAQRRLADLENYKQKNSSEVEQLKAELHHTQKSAREHATACAAAVSAAQLLQIGKDELEAKHNELLSTSKDHGETFDSIREAMAASTEMKSLLERKLDEERMQREKVEEKLRKLRAEHEERTSELELASRKLHDAEELAEKYANEARTHRQAVMSGLDKATSRDISSGSTINTTKVAALETQVETANSLVRKYQAAADSAEEKLRSAEERIAGLEAYQEQTSRESLSIRKQLQGTMRETQSLQAANAEMKYKLANQQLETNAINVQHSTLKDLLGERGISPVNAARNRSMASPQNRTDTPDQSRVRDLEQQLQAVQQAHDETKTTYASREQEAETSYRDKLSQLENDYQSAVHYVKGTEKMLKRMKDELSKYKSENTRMKAELDDAAANHTSREAPSEWEEERSSLHAQISNLQAEIKTSHSQLERQLQDVRRELQSSQQERDQYKQSHEQLSGSVHQARSDLTQLQQENSQLERRALDAEQKVSLLLDQVESSVDNYRRQSRQVGDAGGINTAHARSLSGNESIDNESMYSSTSGATITGDANARNSMALDSLASELETLRTHWETTSKNYRLSTNFDFERPSGASGLGGLGGLGAGQRIDEESGLVRPVASENGRNGEIPELSNSLADWRKRLDAEESEARKGKQTQGAMI